MHCVLFTIWHLWRIAAGQHKRLPTSSLGNLLWALGSLARRGVSRDANATDGEERSEPDNLHHHRLEMNDVYYTLQKEILGRVESPSTGILLQVLWASAFGKQLPKSILDGFAKLILRCANHLDRLANRFEVCETESVESPSVLSNDTIAPHPVQVWQDRQVILKPPGWQALRQMCQVINQFDKWLPHTSINTMKIYEHIIYMKQQP